MSFIQRHTHQLTRYLVTQMIQLEHANKKRLCTIYGRHLECEDDVTLMVIQGLSYSCSGHANLEYTRAGGNIHDE